MRENGLRCNQPALTKRIDPSKIRESHPCTSSSRPNEGARNSTHGADGAKRLSDTDGLRDRSPRGETKTLVPIVHRLVVVSRPVRVTVAY